MHTQKTSELSYSIEHDRDVPIGRTEKGLKFDRYLKGLKRLLNSPDPKAKALVQEANQAILRCKSTPASVHVASILTNLSVQFGNDAYIADRLCPVVPMAGKLSASYFVYGERDRFSYPSDSVTTRGNVNEITENRTVATASAAPRALEEYVDQTTINNQDAPLDELTDATTNVLEGMTFLREKRVASVLTTAGNFGSNTTALTAGSRWDSATGGDPLGDIDAALASIFVGRGQTDLMGYCGLAVWNVLKKHPRILDLMKYNGSAPAMATPQVVAEIFGLKEILIGRAREDTANIGQTAVYSRIWGANSFGIARVATSANLRNLSAAKIFVDNPDRTTNVRYEPAKGAYGGYYAKASTAESDPVVISPKAAYLLTTVIG